MIFEDITDSDNKLRRTRRNKTQLISKYVELKRLEGIYQASTNLRKRKLRHPEVRRYVLRLIHNEIHQRMKPEETFEVWHRSTTREEKKSKLKGKKKAKTKKPDYEDSQLGDDKLTLEIYDFLDTVVPDGVKEEGIDLDLQVDDFDDDEEYEEYDVVSSAKLDQLTKEFDTQNTATKAQFFIESSGMEIMPNQCVSSTHSILNRHINNINTLLHINILRQNWEMSYKLFCIMIRFPMVDIRSIWPLGIEILTQLGTRKSSSPATMKITKFFNYLNSFFTIGYRNTISIERSDRLSIAPAWRSGTRSLTPMYLITSLWHLFVQQEYEQILNKILELILEPPYHREGVLYFIVALCYLCQCCSAVNHFALQHDLDKFNETGATYRSKKECLNFLNLNWSKIESNVNKCKEFNFELPVSELKTQWESIVIKLYEVNKSIENRKVESNVTTVIDTVPDIEETDDWNDIVFNEHDILSPLDTSTQHKDAGFRDVKVRSHDDNDNNAEEDWSQIESDTEVEEHTEKDVQNKGLKKEKDVLVDDNNEWCVISSDSEGEQGEESESHATGEISGKSWRNETPTQHDSAPLYNNDTIPIQQENQVETQIDEDLDLEVDDDWDHIESDPDDIDIPSNTKNSDSFSDNEGESLNEWKESTGSDGSNKVADSVKQVDDSLSGLQTRKNELDFKLNWSQTDDPEVDPSSNGVNRNQKLVNRAFDEIESSQDNQVAFTSDDKTDSKDGDYALEWSQIGDDDVSGKSTLSPRIDQIEETTANDESDKNGHLIDSIKENEQIQGDDYWDLEWTQIDDDVLSSDEERSTTLANTNLEHHGQDIRESDTSGNGYVHPFDSQELKNSKSNGHAPDADISSLSIISQTVADDSIEDSPISFFDYRRNSLELHQMRLKEETRRKSKTKSNKEKDGSLKGMSDNKIKKQSHHKKERKRKHNQQRDKRQ
ncbi:Rrn11 RNA polymerase I subunit [Candida orthopsilosis Co 90-125]|uniref:Rrn11 RNA polymerase I subunit n=1 Tax=Candida orthopsilosis (strain 90-125) TaxID=1136231 RepID=H8X563_CANO9|nr:Rrn11 RNA polymerase I subunit [Candida orthopsilosis Co 90-125]CCG23156.1 Rrn11 RNA polymerase I subunit [Candida orthopsilosis Co 90-125]